jgi:L-amino acid N-acyltransferase YncA
MDLGLFAVAPPAALRAEAAIPSLLAMAPEHLEAVAAIYRNQVEHGLGSLEDPLPDAAEMGRRLAAVEAAGLPALVALDADGDVLGYAWLTPFRLRAHYRRTVEDSLHVAAPARGRGVGSLLLQALVEKATALGLKQMVAVVGDARNRASIRLHERHGFVPAGYLAGAGWKDGEVTDVVLLQRALG